MLLYYFVVLYYVIGCMYLLHHFCVSLHLWVVHKYSHFCVYGVMMLLHSTVLLHWLNVHIALLFVCGVVMLCKSYIYLQIYFSCVLSCYCIV